MLTSGFPGLQCSLQVLRDCPGEDEIIEDLVADAHFSLIGLPFPQAGGGWFMDNLLRDFQVTSQLSHLPIDQISQRHDIHPAVAVLSEIADGQFYSVSQLPTSHKWLYVDPKYPEACSFYLEALDRAAFAINIQGKIACISTYKKGVLIPPIRQYVLL